jgi:hypothetical protein
MPQKRAVILIAIDVFREILTETEYGNKISNRIEKGQLKNVFVTSATIIAILQEFGNDEAVLKKLRRMIFIHMRDDEDKNRSPYISDIPLEPYMWDSAKRWYEEAKFLKTLMNGSLVSMGLVNWCDLAAIYHDKDTPYTVFSKENFEFYESIARVGKIDVKMPFFEVRK